MPIARIRSGKSPQKPQISDGRLAKPQVETRETLRVPSTPPGNPQTASQSLLEILEGPPPLREVGLGPRPQKIYFDLKTPEPKTHTRSRHPNADSTPGVPMRAPREGSLKEWVVIRPRKSTMQTHMTAHDKKTGCLRALSRTKRLHSSSAEQRH